MNTFGVCCNPVGNGKKSEFSVSIQNVGGGAEVYVNTTGPDPFDLRTLVSDGTVGIQQNAETIELSVDASELVSLENVGGFAEVWKEPTGPDPFQLRTIQSSDNSLDVTQNADDLDLTANVSLENVGSGAEVWVDPSGPDPFQLRSITSPDSSVTVVQAATEIELTVPPPAGGTDAFQVDGSNVASTSGNTYVTLETLAGTAKMLDGEEWKINMCVFICHPAALFSINTWVRWQIETSTNNFATFDEWQVNWPITVQVNQPSAPAHRTKNLVAQMDSPRMRCQFRMSAISGAATQVEIPRWGGVQIEEAP